MTTWPWRCALIASPALVISSEAIAQAPAAPPPVITATQVLAILVVCGLMGVVGQGCRTIVGLTNMAMYKLNSPPGEQDLFNLSRLIFSLVIGFVAGFVTALVQWKASGGIDHINVSDFQTMLDFAIAGYIGTDVVEAFTTQFFDKIQPVQKQPAAADAASATELSGLVNDVHSMVSSVAETMGDTTSPVGLFKQKAPEVMSSLIADFALEDYEAAGILGNIGVECNGFTQMQEVSPRSGAGGYGWCQWTGPRRTQFLNWCQKQGLDKDSDAANYGFMKNELATTYKSVIASLKRTTTLEEAVSVVIKQYEQPGVPATTRRISWAKMALAAYEGARA